MGAHQITRLKTEMPHRSEALLVGRDFFLAQFDSEPDCARLVQPATDGPVDDDPLRVASAEVRREVVVLAARPEVVPADLNVAQATATSMCLML